MSAPEKVRAEDAGDVVGLAAEMMREDEATLSPEDLHAVGRELDVPPEYIERARRELARRRAEAAKAAELSRVKRRKAALVLGSTLAALALVLGLWSASSLSSLRERRAEVEARAAQVRNVEARRAAVEKVLAGRPDSPDKDAELVGAENRVRVETRRYAEAAAAYNAEAAGFPASWLLPRSGLPKRVPLEP